MLPGNGLKMDTSVVLTDIFHITKPIIGMIHLRPLPGAPLYDPAKLSMDDVVEIAVEEASKLQSAGVDGLQIENIWDYPYLKGSRIGHETTAALAVAAAKVKDATQVPIGINCHLNAGLQAMAVATAVGAQWIRVFEWVNAYISHAGITEGIGSELSRYRGFLRAETIKFFCDVNVKHGSHFIVSDRTVVEQARDAESEGAEVLIVTGFETGHPPTAENVRELTAHVQVPVIVGSGVTEHNVVELLQYADGAIVGSALKENNNWKNPVDINTAIAFMEKVR
jgi:membrane complex biogenesis BtpA family protein